MAKNGKANLVYVPLTSIQPDKDQPRRMFNASALNNLKESIEEHGIMNPLQVEDIGGGKYLLVDGERRYRAATLAHLKEVPVIIMTKMSELDRLVRQFHIQSQHIDWSSAESAMSVARLKELAGDISLEELCMMLKVPQRMIDKYMSFSKIIDKESFTKSELALDWAETINGVKTTVRKINKENDEPFTKEDEENIEKAIISRLKDGSIRTRRDIAKVKDSFRSDNASIKKFFTTDISAEKLFRMSNAKAEEAHRVVTNYAKYIGVYIRRGRELNFEKLFSESDISVLTKVSKELDMLARKAV